LRLNAIKDKYESLRPLIVWLGLTELVWISYWLLRADNAPLGYTTTVITWIFVMVIWLALVIYAGRRGFFLKHTRWLSNLLGVIIVIAIAIVMFGVIPNVREGIINATTSTTNRELASIHILRLLAIGSVIKYMQCELPLHFVICGALPDFLFAISAVVVTSLVGNILLTQEFLFVWHLIGFSVFFGAGVSMFFSMPSPLRIYQSDLDASIVFKFPMLLAPNFTVPLFMLAHVFALVKLIAGG